MGWLSDEEFKIKDKKAVSPSLVPPPQQPWSSTGQFFREVPGAGKTALRWIGKQLMKPIGTVAVTAEQLGQALGRGEVAPLTQIPSRVGKIIAGREERSFTDIWQENLFEEPTASVAKNMFATLIGTTVDIVADPLNLVGGAGKKALGLAEKGAVKLGEKVPAVKQTTEGLKTMFSTSSGIKEFDVVVDKFKSLGKYRESQVLEGARDIYQEVKNIPEQDWIKVSDYIERGIKSTPEINSLGERLKTAYQGMKELEKAKGIAGGLVENYVPHIPKNTLRDKVKRWIYPAKEFTAELKTAGKERSIAKFVADDGTEIIGVAENHGLAEIGGGYRNVNPKSANFRKIYEIGENVPPEEARFLEKIVTGYKDKSGKIFNRHNVSISEVEETFGRDFYEKNPAIQAAQRGLEHVKAVTGQEFYDAVKKFAVEKGTEVKGIKELAGVFFDEKIAKAIGRTYEQMFPREIQAIGQIYDKVQNWWKAQVLIAPSYHIRNKVGNIWNNFLAGVYDPSSYVQAGLLQTGKAGEIKIAGMGADELMKLAKKRGVVNEGWYAADIPETIEQGFKNWKNGINPLSQQNYAFRANKRVGSAFENNSRLAHFVDKLKKGLSVDDAVMSVKKYLFDYNDLTSIEKNYLKRIIPFYTWTRKNIPLQLEHLITQPAKYAGLEKVVRGVEDILMNGSNPANEKYLSDYIEKNTPMRVGYDKENKSYSYFLLGNWLPSYQAVDFLSQPFYNLFAQLTPLAKTPVEIWANKTDFFKNTLGDAELIERYPGDMVNYLGFNMPKKTAYFLRNIRLLNEIDKLNPGMIFGGETGEPSLQAKMKLASVQTPFGLISAAQQKYGESTVKQSSFQRIANLFFGKLQFYDKDLAEQFYDSDTRKRLDDYYKEYRGAQLKGDKERMEKIEEERNKFIEERLNK